MWISFGLDAHVADSQEYQKKRSKLTRELKDIENETKKVGTRKKQQTPEELQKSIKILTEKVKDLDRLRSEALRQVRIWVLCSPDRLLIGLFRFY